MARIELPPTDELLKEIRRLRRESGITQTRMAKELADKLGIGQPQISRILKGEDPIGYSMAKVMLDYLKASISHVPSDAIADEYRSPYTLEVASRDKKLVDISETMWTNEYSQLPVVDSVGVKPKFVKLDVRFERERAYFGLLNETSVIRFLLSPRSFEMSKGRELVDLTVGDLLEETLSHRTAGKKFRYEGLLEVAPLYSPKSKMTTIVNSMLHYYAILLGDSEDDIHGIITRADLLRMPKRLMPT